MIRKHPRYLESKRRSPTFCIMKLNRIHFFKWFPCSLQVTQYSKLSPSKRATFCSAPNSVKSWKNIWKIVILLNARVVYIHLWDYFESFAQDLTRLEAEQKFTRWLSETLKYYLTYRLHLDVFKKCILCKQIWVSSFHLWVLYPVLETSGWWVSDTGFKTYGLWVSDPEIR